MASAANQQSGEWSDGWAWSDDSLRLHWRERAAAPGVPANRPVLLCLPGMTRTARDFAALGDWMDGRWRVVAVDIRGRGESGWARDPLTYVSLIYLRDLSRILAEAGIDRFVVLGSSLGGQLALQMTTAHRAAMAGVILNDIGPESLPAGLARLRSNVGRGGNWPTWIHAARDLAQRNGNIYPHWQLADWLGFAKRLCRLSPQGKIILDYDPRIAEPLRLPHSDAGSDLWAALDSLSGVPVLSLRAELSDVFSSAAQAELVRRVPGLVAAVVPDVGHAPALDEPAARAAIDDFLERMIAGDVT
ncbi:alpha/beta hydrolase [Sandarakinorhabdus sp.]|uniref:alpha/beta fold hydrolase n=1 Tax=Sandarakinorhabdus sp. TaxID=1916663 RepID=UPI00286E6665|nr:alpha/beta hydrolase [Sandarakinorhabdus sp.]